MRTNNEITGIANEMYAQAMTGVTRLHEENKELVKTILTDSVDSALEKVGLLINYIGSELKGINVEGVSFAGFLTKYGTFCQDELTEIELTVSSKLKAERKFKTKEVVAVNEDFILTTGKVFIDTLFSALYTELAGENIAFLNAKLEEIYAENGIEKKVLFAVEPDNTSRVISIDNDVVVLNADLSKALDVSNLGVLSEGDEYDNYVYEEASKKLVDTMRTVVITPEILKKRIDVVDSLLDLKTKKHANKIIREGYHKQAIYLKDSKSGVGYYNEKVDDVNVFALLKKTEDGNFEVVLNPFDADNLVSVDVDVVAKLA